MAVYLCNSVLTGAKTKKPETCYVSIFIHDQYCFCRMYIWIQDHTRPDGVYNKSTKIRSKYSAVMFVLPNYPQKL